MSFPSWPLQLSTRFYTTNVAPALAVSAACALYLLLMAFNLSAFPFNPEGLLQLLPMITTAHSIYFLIRICSRRSTSHSLEGREHRSPTPLFQGRKERRLYSSVPALTTFMYIISAKPYTNAIDWYTDIPGLDHVVFIILVIASSVVLVQALSLTFHEDQDMCTPTHDWICQCCSMQKSQVHQEQMKLDSSRYHRPALLITVSSILSTSLIYVTYDQWWGVRVGTWPGLLLIHHAYFAFRLFQLNQAKEDDEVKLAPRTLIFTGGAERLNYVIVLILASIYYPIGIFISVEDWTTFWSDGTLEFVTTIIYLSELVVVAVGAQSALKAYQADRQSAKKARCIKKDHVWACSRMWCKASYEGFPLDDIEKVSPWSTLLLDLPEYVINEQGLGP
jgi:hypothetical protein